MKIDWRWERWVSFAFGAYAFAPKVFPAWIESTIAFCIGFFWLAPKFGRK